MQKSPGTLVKVLKKIGRFFKKIGKFFKKPAVGIVLLAVGLLSLFAKDKLPIYPCTFTQSYLFAPIHSAFSDSGLALFNIAGQWVFCIEGEGTQARLRYVLTPRDMNISGDDIEYTISGVALDEQDNAYILVAGGESAVTPIDYETVLMFDRDGRFVREVCRRDAPRNGAFPQYDKGIMAIHAADGCLTYVVEDRDKGVSIVKQSVYDSADCTRIPVDPEVLPGITSIFATKDGNFAVHTVKRTLGILSADGAYRDWYVPDSPMEGGKLFNQIAYVDGAIYAVNAFNDIIYRVEEDGKLTEVLRTISDDGRSPFGSNSRIVDIHDLGGRLGMRIDISLYVLDGGELASRTYSEPVAVYGGELSQYPNLYELPFGMAVENAALQFCSRTWLPFVVAGALLCIGCLLRWRISLLSKLLLLAIPAIIAMNLLILNSIETILSDNYYEDLENELIMAGDLIAKNIDADLIDRVIESDFSDQESIRALNDQMFDSLNGSGARWSQALRAYIYLNDDVVSNVGVEIPYDQGENMVLADSGFYYTPLHQSAWLDPERLETRDGTDCLVFKYEDVYRQLQYTSVLAPIAASDGESRAYVMLGEDDINITDKLNEVRSKYLILAGISFPVVILVLWLVCFVAVRYLKKASDAVAVIAKGDFSTRIQKTPHDEVGEICQGVNSMAAQLEQYFEMKSRNEKFYYKFVPEKFRELLHKEEFTDLALGDAENVDLTVLFCDIRAFSLNSEMMTAKESFEFINIIYGIAGPIIRKHGGFVDKYIGDAVMALFENADEAVAAGIELYDQIVLDGRTAEKLKVSAINIGVGIHSGMARIGIVGEDERMSGTVISDTVNMSSRLESLTKQYATAMIISKDTLDRLTRPDALNIRYLGMVQVAGVNEVKALYEVLDCLDEAQREMRSATKTQFRDAIRMFHLDDFKGALALLEKIHAEFSDDPVIGMYIDYIRDKLDSGNTEHAVFRFTKK